MITAEAFTTPDAPSRLWALMVIDWHIGDVITKLRKEKRWNQTALAVRVGVNKATIVRAEDGEAKVSRDTYLKIAAVLGIDLARLESEAARLQGKGSQSNTSGPPFQEWDGKSERRHGPDRRVASANEK